MIYVRLESDTSEKNIEEFKENQLRGEKGGDILVRD